MQLAIYTNINKITEVLLTFPLLRTELVNKKV